MSVHMTLPMAPGRSRVPAHVAAPEAAGAERAHAGNARARFRGNVPDSHATPEAARAPGGAPRAPRASDPAEPAGPSTICRAPFDAATVPPKSLPLWSALRDVLDPELPISVVDMGLIYDVRLVGAVAEVTLTYTATGCPCVDFIRTDITERLLAEPGVDAVELHEVWSPPWTRAMMTEEGRVALRALGVAA
ncbi:MAG TPA: iron-sulfur cluster assembly protein [Longimicrobiales bacterium]|nr:iron-sulfur cluster assembly protein [Longimicrobiales bacterium]